jgi:hypothetical protein
MGGLNRNFNASYDIVLASKAELEIEPIGSELRVIKEG